MANHIVYSLQLVLVFVAVVFSMKINNNNNINIKSAQDMMRLLSVPQKSKAFPQNVFKVSVHHHFYDDDRTILVIELVVVVVGRLRLPKTDKSRLCVKTDTEIQILRQVTKQ